MFTSGEELYRKFQHEKEKLHRLPNREQTLDEIVGLGYMQTWPKDRANAAFRLRTMHV